MFDLVSKKVMTLQELQVNAPIDLKNFIEDSRDIKLGPLYLDEDIIVVDNIKLLEAPYATQIKTNIIAYCRKGKMTADCNSEPIAIHAGQAFICPPGVSLRNVMISTDFEYQAIGLTTKAMQLYLREYMSIWNQFAYIEKLRILVQNDDVSTQFYDLIYPLIKLVLQPQDDPENKRYCIDIFKSLLQAALIAICRILRQNGATEIKKPKVSQNLTRFNQFLDLLHNSEKKHRTVEYYASQLCMSPKYLTVICKKNSKKTANEWITEYTVADIIHYLQNTNMTIKEIADKVGFPNTSFFGKYVKDHLGCTPIEYRYK